jgi:glycosyltransferase involved in cell wall biosynthesis
VLARRESGKGGCNYLPRKCGIAMFTSDLLHAVAARHPRSRCFAVPVNDTDGCYQYPDVVRFEIEEQDLGSYRQAADFLNSSNVDIVSVQHEFGIFGGPAGSHLLALLRELKAPAVTTLHTVLLKPNVDQHRVMRKIDCAFNPSGGYDGARPDDLAGGLPGVTSEDRSHPTWDSRRSICRFEFLQGTIWRGRKEGVAHVRAAVAPHQLRTRGEAYRHDLEAIAREHKLENHVIFQNRFVGLKELTEFIGAADVYITPYLDEGQSTSGTLAYAFGAGDAVISTPYRHAVELLRDQRGVLAPFADPKAIALELNGLLRDETRRKAMSDNAYKLGRTMVWSNMARFCMRSFEVAQQQTIAAPRESVGARKFRHRPHAAPTLRLDHLTI